jgi:hypothetical protein
VDTFWQAFERKQLKIALLWPGHERTILIEFLKLKFCALLIQPYLQYLVDLMRSQEPSRLNLHTMMGPVTTRWVTKKPIQEAFVEKEF